MNLTGFQVIRPAFESTQEETLNWFVEAHVQAEGSENFRSEIQEKLRHVGCKPEHIQKRGHVLDDYLHTRWDEMKVYRLHESKEGQNLSVRSNIFDREVEKVFDQYYPEDSSPPDNLIHVSCTGYVSPSGAQKIVSKRNWGENTTVTHCYHMGCYGSIPAIRIGMGFLYEKELPKIDIVHTEICSLHTNPAQHQLDQLVSQSLFADGFIKYSAVKKTDLPHFKVLAVKEEIVPNSLKAMTWNVAEWGFQMSLTKEVPVMIKRHLPKFLERFSRTFDSKTLFAVHPGGPKILHYIQDLLKLSDYQMSFSKRILKDYGNMSSATLPHIWHKILQDPKVDYGTQILSLAFGPGLTIAGVLMEKKCGSSV